MKIQYTINQSSDTTLESIHLSMKSDDKSYASDSSSSQEGNIKGQKKRKKKNDCNVKTNKVIKANQFPPKNTEGRFLYQSILDSGTEWTIIGCPAWDIQKIYSKMLNMSAVDDSMRGISMNCCNAVTSVKNSTGQIHLFGITLFCSSSTQLSINPCTYIFPCSYATKLYSNEQRQQCSIYQRRPSKTAGRDSVALS
eukprot:11451099-Ditylum_brightwellii.AAC.1